MARVVIVGLTAQLKRGYTEKLYGGQLTLDTALMDMTFFSGTILLQLPLTHHGMDL